MIDKFAEQDYLRLDKVVNQKKSYRLADIKDKIEKVAFDVVRFKDDDDLSNLWIVKSTDEGDVIVAMYDEEPLESKSQWSVIPDKKANVNIFYKNEPIKRFAVSSFGIPNEDVFVVCRMLKDKLASDKAMRLSMLSEISSEERTNLVKKYPELLSE